MQRVMIGTVSIASAVLHRNQDDCINVAVHLSVREAQTAGESVSAGHDVSCPCAEYAETLGGAIGPPLDSDYHFKYHVNECSFIKVNNHSSE